MSKQMVHHWCSQFSEGRQSAHDEERSGRPSLINVELVRQRVMENRRFTITELSIQLLQISRSLLHGIVSKHLLFKKLKTSVIPWLHSQAAEFYHRDLLLLEEQEGSVNFKFGVLFAKARQTTDDEMFSNGVFESLGLPP
ncbi:uncharacterized protein TNCV_2136621 [Trichonephila clavipes]|nr:uncharacterized protein TNCV_2136621 [Trichonephila clavipes]